MPGERPSIGSDTENLQSVRLFLPTMSGQSCFQIVPEEASASTLHKQSPEFTNGPPLCSTLPWHVVSSKAWALPITLCSPRCSIFYFCPPCPSRSPFCLPCSAFSCPTYKSVWYLVPQRSPLFLLLSTLPHPLGVSPPPPTQLLPPTSRSPPPVEPAIYKHSVPLPPPGCLSHIPTGPAQPLPALPFTATPGPRGPALCRGG
jgi:hypothetical protein